jgi:hypothetical protein
MNEPLYPTAEAIEAALSDYDAQRPDGSLNDEGELFMEIMASNERLRAEIHRAAEFVGELDVPPEMTEFTAEEIRLYKVNMLCDMFFWVGWHARGAIDDRERLKRMAGLG